MVSLSLASTIDDFTIVIKVGICEMLWWETYVNFFFFIFSTIDEKLLTNVISLTIESIDEEIKIQFNYLVKLMSNYCNQEEMVVYGAIINEKSNGTMTMCQNQRSRLIHVASREQDKVFENTMVKHLA